MPLTSISGALINNFMLLMFYDYTKTERYESDYYKRVEKPIISYFC